MRQFIRHPSDIPICYDFTDEATSKQNTLNNISQGGLCFQASSYIKPGCNIHIHIKLLEPAFEAEGVVVWCKESQGCYETGVRLQDAETEYSVRMIEQICHIEQYRMQALEKEGKKLSPEEAATEWIALHAADFPQ